MSGPQRGGLPWRNEDEERGDLQQPQGAQPLEGQRRDALEGVVAEDPAGRKGADWWLPGAVGLGWEGTSGGDGSGHYLDYGDGSTV